MNQKLAVAVLEKFGYRVEVVADGREAVGAVARGGYDLVLMDCQMPELDGYAAATEIRRRQNGGPRIPDRRDDRERDAGRAGALPRRRHGRLRDQADRPPPAAGGGRPVARRRRAGAEDGRGAGGEPERRSIWRTCSRSWATSPRRFGATWSCSIRPPDRWWPTSAARSSAATPRRSPGWRIRSRGSCGSIGASGMADVVGRLEDRSRSGEWDAMEELYRHLEQSYQQVRTFTATV